MKVLITLAFILLSASSFALTPSRMLNIEGMQIAAYESEGTKGPGVLLIHGNTSSAEFFEKVLSSPFAKQYKVAAIDLQGFGRSSRQPFYTAGTFANTIAMSAELLGVDHGVIAGWSLGGDLALQAAHLLPHVKGYFLFGTAPVGFDPSLPPSYLTPEESYAGAAVYYGFNPALTPEQIADYVTAFFRPNYNVPQSLIAEGLNTDPNTRLAVYFAVTGQDASFKDEIAIVRNLSVPVALVVGDQEAFVRKSFLDALAPSMPTLWQQKVYLVNNAGHAIQWEKAHQFTTILKRFIKSIQ